MIRVGFIGCGRIADLHALEYQDNPEACIHAVCDRDATLLDARKKAWGAARAYTDYRELLADDAVDAVEVLTPYDTHEEVVIAAAKAGKHIACQKPTATTLASADRMAAAARRAGVIYKTTEVYVCFPPIVRAKELIESGAIGEPLGMRINFVASSLGGWTVPGRTLEQQMRIAGTGLGMETFDHGHHEWATAWFLMGEAERVNAWVDSVNGIIDLPAMAMWKCRGGKRYGVIDFMFAPDLHIPSQYYSNDEWYQVVGSRGVLFVNRGTGELMDRPPVSHFDGHRWTHHDDVPGDWAEGFRGATRNFIGAILGREEPLLNPGQAREVMRFGLAAMHSAKRRREFFLDEIDGGWGAWWKAWRQRRRDRRDCIVGPQGRKWAWGKGSDSQYASQAESLMDGLSERFDAGEARDWDVDIGLTLLADGGEPERKYTLSVHGGVFTMERDAHPESPDLTIWLPSGTWAAILLGKRRVETAVFTGKIKYDGRPEKALPLRNAFRL